MSEGGKWAPPAPASPQVSLSSATPQKDWITFLFLSFKWIA